MPYALDDIKTLTYLAQELAGDGRNEQAAAVARRVTELASRQSAAAKQRYIASAMKRLAVREVNPGLSWGQYAEGCLHARAGENAAALRCIERALDNGLRDFEQIQTDPDLEELRQEDSFQDLLHRYEHAVTG